MLLKEQHLLTSFLYDKNDIKNLEKFLQINGIDFSPFIEHISLANIIEDGYIRAEVYKDSFTRLEVVPNES